MINKKTKPAYINDSKKIKDSSAVKIFRERLGQLRTRKNTSQQSISDLLGVSRQTIAKYETMNTASLPDIKQFCTLCDHFGVSPNYLLNYSDIECDHKKNYGLSDETINLLNSNPHIHQFFDFFVKQLAENNLEKSISQIGISNNVEKAWERVFPKNLIMAINKAYISMVEKAAFSASINSTEMEKELRAYFPKPDSFTAYFKKDLNQDGKNFILQEEPDFNSLSDQEQYDCFIAIISSHFVEIKSIQYVYHAEHEKISQKIIDIINDYVELINAEKIKE